VSSSISKRVPAIVVSALTVVFIVATAAIIGWFFAGGYWENVALLDTISGPMRFREFVCDPIPENIYDVRGGYSGFPQGFVGTLFRYSGELPLDSCFKDWTEIPREALDSIAIRGISEAQITQVFVHGRRPIPGGYLGNLYEKYLVVDEASKRGYLYVP